MARRPFGATAEGRRVQQMLGVGAQVQGGPLAQAGPQPPDLVGTGPAAAVPPPCHWALLLPGDACALDLLFFGVPRGLHPAVFAARCAAAGVPRLAEGRFQRHGKLVRVTITDRALVVWLCKYGVAGYSKHLRYTQGWRCAADVPAGRGRGAATPFGSCAAAAQAEREFDLLVQRLTGGRQSTPSRQVLPATAPQVGSRRLGLRLGSWNVAEGIAARAGGSRLGKRTSSLTRSRRGHSPLWPSRRPGRGLAASSAATHATHGTQTAGWLRPQPTAASASWCKTAPHCGPGLQWGSLTPNACTACGCACRVGAARRTFT